VADLTEVDPLLRERCSAFLSAPPVTLGSWNSVLIQVAVRVAESYPKSDTPAVLAGIIARRLP
jgi:hypothetical protein